MADGVASLLQGVSKKDAPTYLPMECCDVDNYVVWQSSSSTISRAGLTEDPAYGTFTYSNWMATSKCQAGYQCVTCNPDKESTGVTEAPFCQNRTSGQRRQCLPGTSGNGVCVPCLVGDLCAEGVINLYAHSLATVCPDGWTCEYDYDTKQRRVSYNLDWCPEGHACPLGTSRPSDYSSCQAQVIKAFDPTVVPPVVYNASAVNWTTPPSTANFIPPAPPGVDPESREAFINSFLQAPGPDSDSLTEVLQQHDVFDALWAALGDEPTGFHCRTGTSGFEDLLKRPVDRVQVCPKGWYCPHTSDRQKCPVGHFCKTAVDQPTKCPMGSCRSTGMSRPAPAVYRTWMIAVFLLMMWLASKIVRWWVDSRSQNRSLALETAISARQLKSKLVSQILQGLDGVTDLVSAPQGFDDCEMPITIEFENLELTVGAMKILSGPSGRFAPSRMVALMGPSGCGKSTLVNTLCGKATYGEVSGVVRVNGERRLHMATLRQVMGFVPQEDAVFGDLTVLENVRFSALLRLPRSYSQAQVAALVEGVVEVLGLVHIQNSLVGDVERRGISGGQKKRVNIGVEMVASPSVLFLDEPTSGLASTDTVIVMKALHAIALTKRTVVAVVHQPRYQVFMLFHDVMLLFPGGFTVFFGPSYLVGPYFSHIGYPTPADENPADFFIDIISGAVCNSLDHSITATALPSIWTEKADVEGGLEKLLKGAERRSSHAHSHRLDRDREVHQVSREITRRCLRYFREADKDGGGSLCAAEVQELFAELGLDDANAEVNMEALFGTKPDGTISLEEFEGLFEETLELINQQHKHVGSARRRQSAAATISGPHPGVRPRATGHRDTVWFPVALWIVLQRCCLQKLAGADEMLSHWIILALCGLLIGSFLGSNQEPFDPEDGTMLLMFAICTTIVSTLSCITSIRFFTANQVMLEREREAGMSLLAGYLARCSLDALENALQPVFFLGVSYQWMLPQTRFREMLTTLFFGNFAASGMGILASSVLRQGSAILSGIILCLVFGMMMNGTRNPSMEDIKTWEGSHRSFGLAIWACSYSRWTVETLIVNELLASSKALYQQLAAFSILRLIGYYPRWVTWEQHRAPRPQGGMEGEVEEWREDYDEWMAYTESYKTVAYTALALLGLGLRVVAYLVLAATPALTRTSKDLKIRLLNHLPRQLRKAAVWAMVQRRGTGQPIGAEDLDVSDRALVVNHKVVHNPMYESTQRVSFKAPDAQLADNL